MERQQQKRKPKVEALRLVAIGGIAIFHTFVPWFNKLAYGAPSLAQTDIVRSSWIGLFLLGNINLLGAMGNTIFFMISGYFLLPSMVHSSYHGGYWKKQLMKTIRRSVVIVTTVIVYGLLTYLLVRFCSIPGPDFHTTRWLVMDLEFVWLYLLFVLIAPVIAWIQARFYRQWRLIVFCSLILIFIVNMYIAFCSQGGVNHTLTGWRKWASAVTYLVGFCLVGLDDFHAVSRFIAHVSLWGVIILSILIEAVLALFHLPVLIGDISFKSTSLLSFALAYFALALSVTEKRPLGQHSIPQHAKHSSHTISKTDNTIRMLAAGILGFYIFQSMLTHMWHSFIIPFLNNFVTLPGGNESVRIIVFVCLGILLSLLYTTLILLLDHYVRQPITQLLASRFH